MGFVKEDDVLQSIQYMGFDDGVRTHVLGILLGRVIDAYGVPAHYPGVHMSSALCVESSMCSLGYCLNECNRRCLSDTHHMQKFARLNISLWKPPYVLVVLPRLEQEIEVPLTSPVEVFEIVRLVRLVNARQGLVHLVLDGDLHELGGLVPFLGGIQAKRRAECPALASSLLDVEARLEGRALLEVKLGWEGVAQGAVYAGLVDIKGFLKGRRRAGEQRGPVEDDGCVQARTRRRLRRKCTSAELEHDRVLQRPWEK